MKTQTKQKSRFRGFYTALFLSLLMIGAACVFAYRQTSQTLEQNLNSLNEQMELTEAESETEPYEAPVVGVQTDVAKPAETTAPPAATTAPATETAATAAETVPETAPPEETPIHQLTPPLADFAILNPFSDGELIKSETTGTWQTHNGVDLSCAAGADVFAIDTGTVSIPPLLTSPSTKMIPRLNPEMIRFRNGKWKGMGSASKGYSLRIRPFPPAIFLSSGACSDG